MNEFLATVPFDLYELALFHLVVKHRSFTKAAELAGVTQSAITRQMQGLEHRLGLDLLERTTRSVRVTPAGEFLYRDSARLLGDVGQSLKRLREEFSGARKEVRVGVSRSIGLAYLPGFFHANLRRLPSISCRVSHQPSSELLIGIEANELDLAVLCMPSRLPSTVQITHKFQDAFTLVMPAGLAVEFSTLPNTTKERRAWLNKQDWLLLTDDTNTGRRLRTWMNRQGWRREPVMQLDNFDLLINLVALGMGVSFVPVRALALYGQKKSIQRVALPKKFTRELVVVVRRHRKLPEHLRQFVDNVLF